MCWWSGICSVGPRGSSVPVPFLAPRCLLCFFSPFSLLPIVNFRLAYEAIGFTLLYSWFWFALCLCLTHLPHRSTSSKPPLPVGMWKSIQLLKMVYLHFPQVPQTRTKRTIMNCPMVLKAKGSKIKRLELARTFFLVNLRLKGKEKSLRTRDAHCLKPFYLHHRSFVRMECPWPNLFPLGSSSQHHTIGRHKL